MKKQNRGKRFELHLLQPIITFTRGYIPDPCFNHPSYHLKILHNDKEEAKRLYESAVKGFSAFKYKSTTGAKRLRVDWEGDNIIVILAATKATTSDEASNINTDMRLGSDTYLLAPFLLQLRFQICKSRLNQTQMGN